MRYYIASRLGNASRVQELKKILDDKGWEHTYDWTVHGSVQKEGHARIAEVAEAETNGVIRADVVIVLLPGGRGTHAELGMAIANRARILLVSEDPETDFGDGGNTCAFYHHRWVKQLPGWDALLDYMGV